MPGEQVKAESGGMVSMSTNVHMEARLEGTTAEALTRCCCSGESMFLTYYSLKPGEVWLRSLLWSNTMSTDFSFGRVICCC